DGIRDDLVTGVQTCALPISRYLSAWRHTVSDCGSTPATESNTATAPSSTRSERSTSAVKSTWPGVSMMLMRWSRQKQVVAADVRSEERRVGRGGGGGGEEDG